jgi:hypothetical protein
MDLIKEVKSTLNKIQPHFKNINDIENLINEKDLYFRTKVISNIYVTPTGKLRYKGNQRSKPIYLKKYQLEFSKSKNLMKFIQKGHLDDFIIDKTERLKERNLEKIFPILEDYEEPKRNFTNNRLDYILTTFPSEFILKLTLEGEYIKEIDLVNSQLCILFNFLDQLKAKSGNLLQLSNASLIFNLYSQGKLNTYLCSDFWVNYDAKDVQLFKKHVYNGLIYDELVKVSMKKNANPISRDKVKEMVFSLIFCKYNSYKLKQQNLISVEFPNVLKLFKSLKQSFEKSISAGVLEPIKSSKAQQSEGKWDMDYLYGNNYLPILLQRMESEVFIDHLLPLLYKESLCCLPKHDSILTNESNLKAVKDLMEAELNKFLGANFKLKIK